MIKFHPQCGWKYEQQLYQLDNLHGDGVLQAASRYNVFSESMRHVGILLPRCWVNTQHNR